MSPYSCYIKKGLVYITIINLSGRQPSFYLECTKANTCFLYNVRSVSLNKYIFLACLTSLYISKLFMPSGSTDRFLTAPIRAVRSSRRHSHSVSCQEPVRRPPGPPGPLGAPGAPGPSGLSGLLRPLGLSGPPVQLK